MKQNRSIKGITINALEEIMAQFADDASLFLKYDQDTLNAVCETLSFVEANIGHKISYEKTNLYRIGSLCNSNAKLYTSKDLCWTNDNIKLLGTTISCDGSEINDNYDKIMEKLRKVCNNWFNRSMTLSGKTVIINTLMGSLFVYHLSSMLSLTEDQILEVQDTINRFLWKGKRARIRMQTLQLNRKQGGLKLVYIRAKQKALRVQWVKKLKRMNF